ncbi:uncharacterized protein [Haliotis asinina]|uniref:uncharacterized protein n=1 Tax=Haliotis asinina TaxID=109174 RepID=UPI00353262CB
MSFIIRHQLSGEALKDLLVLIELHCITPNFCRTTLKTFNNFFKGMSSPVQLHYFCNFCNTYHGKASEPTCQKCQKSEQSSFIYIPMIGQLQSLFSGLKKSDLLHEGGRVKDNPSAIEDIFDGKIYKTIFVDNFFKGTKEGRKEKEIHISLQLNTDGVALFRSSTYSVWPLYLTVNELNPKLRYSAECRLFAGLWYGINKPTMSIFLQPLVEELKSLYEKGLFVMHGRSLLLRAILHSVVCDAPARCLVQNFVQFNGYYGCGSCLSKGKSVKTGERGSMMSYPFDISEAGNLTGVSTPRTHTQSLTDARRAEQHRSCQNGVKGFSPLYKLPFFDMIRCVTVDYMHCVLLGVQKKFLHLWTDSANKHEKFYIGNFTSILNERLQRLSPPNLITRMPRCIEDLKNWKASEFRSFLLFYSVCCLYHILPDEYLTHYLLLVEGIFILLQRSVSHKQLSRAKVLIAKFCASVDFLYSERNMTSNMHALLHLAQKVEDLGPLWCHSCFFYEDLNGDLRSLFHGTQKVELQISVAVVIHQKLPQLCALIPKFSEAEYIYLSLKGKHHRKNIIWIKDNMFAVNPIKPCNLSVEIQNLVDEFINAPITRSAQFYRYWCNGIMFHSKMYKNVTRRNSYSIQYIGMDQKHYLGQIQYYLVLFTEKSSVYCALVKRFIKEHKCHLHVPAHFVEVETGTLFDLIPVENIKNMCVYMDQGSVKFVALMPNVREKD